MRPVLPLLAVVALAIVLYGRGWSQSRGVYGDSFHHLMNGIFLFDAAHDAVSAMSDPLGYATNYYRHFPAVNLGYYPPVFAATEAALMGIFGVSSVVGQLVVLVAAVMMAVLAYAWLRERFDPWWAAATAAVLLSTPLLVRWGRDIMLEIPVLALMIGAMWGFERVLRSDRPTWSSVLLWVLFSSLALWTKQHAILLLSVFAIAIVSSGRWSHFKSGKFLLGGLVVALAAGALTAMMLRLGGDAVGHTLGFTKQHVASRFNFRQWSYYLWELPRIVTWPTLALSLLGLWWVLRRREPFASPLLAWIVMFYLMHSYFRGHQIRYGCLWVPPFVVLASVGLKHIPYRVSWGAWRGRAGSAIPVGGIVLVLWAGLTVCRGAMVEVPRIPSAYQRVAHDLCERLGPFTCLTFFPDRPGRPAVNHRLALEELRGEERDVYSFGRMVRASQLLRDWPQRWKDLDSLDASLREWNVKFVLTETPRPIDPRTDDAEIAAAIDGLVAGGSFRPIRRYAVTVSRKVPQRTLVLHERVAPLQYQRDAAPPLRLSRIRVTIGDSGSPGQP